MLHGDSHSHSSFSGSVTRCFALRLLLRGEYCSLRHHHTATSPAKRGTTRLAISHASLNSRAALDVSTYVSYCSSENVCSPESTQQPIAVHGLGIPSTTVSQQPIAIRMVEWSRHVGYVGLTNRPHCHHRRLAFICPLKNSGNRLSFTSSGSRTRRFPRRSGKASTLRRILHTTRRPEIVRHCSRVLSLLRWMLSVAAVVRAVHVVATCANPRSASLTKRSLLPRHP